MGWAGLGWGGMAWHGSTPTLSINLRSLWLKWAPGLEEERRGQPGGAAAMRQVVAMGDRVVFKSIGRSLIGCTGLWGSGCMFGGGLACNPGYFPLPHLFGNAIL